MNEFHAVTVAAIPAAAAGITLLVRRHVELREFSPWLVRAGFVGLNLLLGFAAHFAVPVSYLETALVASAACYGYALARRDL
jgi:hypothetical protein